jgi:hypothetical protein
MFIGHFVVGFAAKRVAPRLSLAALFAAAQLADVMWPVLVGLGIEQVHIDPGNTAFANLGSPPPSITAVVMVGIAGTVVLILWAWSFDHHRTALL